MVTKVKTRNVSTLLTFMAWYCLYFKFTCGERTVTFSDYGFDYILSWLCNYPIPEKWEFLTNDRAQEFTKHLLPSGPVEVWYTDPPRIADR